MRSRRTVLLFVWLTLVLCPARVLCAQASPERALGERNSTVPLIGIIAALEALVIVALLVDRNRKKRAARQPKESEERFAKVFRANPQPMILTAMETGRIIDVNESALTLTGYTREEIIGRTSLDLGVFNSEEHRKA